MRARREVNAEGIVQEGDILLAITRPPTVRATTLHAPPRPSPHANRARGSLAAPVTVERDGVTRTSPTTRSPSATEPGSARIYLTSGSSLPVDISFSLEGVGG